MLQLLLVALGGACGAMARYWITTHWVRNADHLLPLGTLLANVGGSLIMGVLYVLIIERAVLPPELRQLLMVGFLGALTTFSSFSLESVALWQQGHMLAALIYISLSVLLCLTATAAGVGLTRILI